MELKRLAGLDGLRGLAVIAVILYHGGVSWSGGGFLGVEVFFVLSGFLITSLLLAEWLSSGAIALRAFWARRARRLLPALFVLVVAIGIYYAAEGPSKAVPGFWGDGLAALLYYSNWHQIAAGTNYFAASGPVSPFQHTWSLSIEEQFYVVWPLLVLGVAGWVRRRVRDGQAAALRTLFVVSVTGAIASAVEMALVFDGGRGLDRVYYGTDTRASGLLAGAALATFFALRRHRRESQPEQVRTVPGAGRGRLLRGCLSGASGALLVGVLVEIWRASGSASWVYPYGFVAIDLAVVGLIAAVALLPRSVAARVLALPPLQATGRISYGLYLWHFPLFLWIDSEATGLSGMRLLLVRLTATVVISVLSYVLIEQPIRQRRRPTWMLRVFVPLGAGGAVAALLVASAATALPTGVPASDTLPSAPPALQGSGPACSVTLNDTSQYGLAPIPAADEAKFEYAALGNQKLTWSGSAEKTFETCPPKKMLVIGDSLAFTLGLPMLENEQQYGVEVANAALLGCAFGTRGELDVNGTWEAPPADCPDALSEWADDEKALGAKEVIVELGYRDEFDWKWDGKVVHLGDKVYDDYVQQQMDDYVKVLGRNGTKILFLSVPYTHPPDQADGAPAPAASPERHAEINAMLEHAAKTDSRNVHVLDIDSTISPGNHYDAKVDGQLCRFDGIHFSLFCGELLEPQILGDARALLAH